MRRTSRLALLLLAACGPGPRPIDRPGADLQYNQIKQAATVCAAGATVEGVDVSVYEGTIDWAQVHGAGKEFAITRIGDGLGGDSTFKGNWAAIKQEGMIRGAYQYFRTGDDPIAQADIVIAAVGQLGPGDLPVTCDVEEPKPSVTPSAYNSLLHQWADHVEQGTGKRPMIYTGRYYWDPYIATTDFAGYPLWHAQYTLATCPNIADEWSTWAFWQYRAEAYPPVPAGSCPGINGAVDLDVFNGSLDDLRKLANANSPPNGTLEEVDCTQISGWAQDPDALAQAIEVDVTFDGAAGDPGATLFSMQADRVRADLCSQLGSCNHGFLLAPPAAFLDGSAHVVHAYGIDSAGGPNTELTSSPRTFQCVTPSDAGPNAGTDAANAGADAGPLAGTDARTSAPDATVVLRHDAAVAPADAASVIDAGNVASPDGGPIPSDGSAQSSVIEVGCGCATASNAPSAYLLLGLVARAGRGKRRK